MSPPVPRFRAKQLLHAVYVLGARSLDEASLVRTLGVPLVARLKQKFCVEYPRVLEEQVSPADQTRKLLCGFSSAKQRLLVDKEGTPLATAAASGDQVETVFIPMGRDGESLSGAVCVSSQVGCSLSCSFCATGQLMSKKGLRNLSTAEIVGQVLAVKHSMGDFRPEVRRGGSTRPAVSTIVFMGMGEPLLNWRAVRGAIDVLTDHPRAGGAGCGLGLGRGRVTVSTSGVVPAIDALRESYGGNVALAVSLHAANDALRDELVPCNKTHRLDALMAAVRRYQDLRVVEKGTGGGGGGGTESELDDSGLPLPAQLAGRLRVTFEYTMLAGVNDALSEALSLARLLDGLHCLVNLIPFNPWPGTHYVSSHPEHIQAFARELQRLGVAATIRWPRGRDIQGACGQLAAKQQPAPAQEQQRA